MGRHSLETHGAPSSVGSLVRSGRVGGEVANDAECEEARKKWIELRVLEGEKLIASDDFYELMMNELHYLNHYIPWLITNRITEV